jgi:hypothetical protein
MPSIDPKGVMAKVDSSRQKRMEELAQLREQSKKEEYKSPAPGDDDDMASSLSLSQLMNPQSKQTDLYVQMDLLREMAKDHENITRVLQERNDTLRTMLDWWTLGNSKQALRALHQQEEPGIVIDFLRAILTPEFRRQMTAELSTLVLAKSVALIQHKNLTYIRYGVGHCQYVVNAMRDEVVQTLTFSPLGRGVDLAREERVGKFRQLLEQFRFLAGHPRLARIIDKQHETESKAEVARMCRTLL